MSAHTPGPWQYDNVAPDDGDPEFEILGGRYGPIIAELVEKEEDARLIAAAPDMLAALQACHAAAEGKPVGEVISVVLHVTSAAIAKAERAP